MSTAADAAQHIFMSLNRFNELLNAGVFDRAQRNGYDLDVIREKYILYQRKIAAGRPEKLPGMRDLTSERAKLVEQQTETASFKLAVSQGKYVLKSKVAEVVGSIFNTVRERLLAREGKLCDRLVMREHSEITKVVHDDTIETLNELSDPATYAYGQPADDLDSAGDDGVRGTVESDADRMGRHVPAGVE